MEGKKAKGYSSKTMSEERGERERGEERFCCVTVNW
jgi:hypothetical protein